MEELSDQKKIDNYLDHYSYFIKNINSRPLKSDDIELLKKNENGLNEEIINEVQWLYHKTKNKKYFNYILILCFLIGGFHNWYLTLACSTLCLIYNVYYNYRLWDSKFKFIKYKYLLYPIILLTYLIVISIVSIYYPQSNITISIQEFNDFILLAFALFLMIISLFA